MSWIRAIDEREATGDLLRQYEEARRRAGRVFNVIKIQSLNPRALEASSKLYLTLMYGPSRLSRIEREAIATVVSRASDCFY